MPNQHDPRKRSLAVYILRERYYQVKRLAERMGISMTRLLEILIEKAVREIELTPEDYEQIAKEVRNAQSTVKVDYRKVKRGRVQKAEPDSQE